MAQNLDAEVTEKLLDNRPDGDARGGFAGAGAFEDVTGVRLVVFDRSGEIGVAGTRPRNRLVLCRVAGFDRQGFGPVLPVGVGDDHGDRGADGMAVANAGDNTGSVGLDLHASAAAIALLAAPEFVIDLIEGDRYTGRESSQGCHETFAVGLSSRFEPKHVG